jgi:Fe-S cluster biogenesis protein NfuA
MTKKERAMQEAIHEVLESVRPALAAEGGALELVEIADDGTVKVRLTGLCGTCVATLWTFRLRIERAMKEKLPEVKVLVQV